MWPNNQNYFAPFFNPFAIPWLYGDAQAESLLDPSFGLQSPVQPPVHDYAHIEQTENVPSCPHAMRDLGPWQETPNVRSKTKVTVRLTTAAFVGGLPCG